jgi:hypothetical protein
MVIFHGLENDLVSKLPIVGVERIKHKSLPFFFEKGGFLIKYLPSNIQGGGGRFP